MLFKSLLEPSWADLRPLRPPKSCCGPHGARFFKNHILSTNRTRKPNLGTKRSKMTPRWHPKTIQNRPKIDVKNQSKFRCHFGLVFDASWVPVGLPRGPLLATQIAPRSAQDLPKRLRKIDPNFDVILVSFLVPLGSLLASLLGPFLAFFRFRIALGHLSFSKTSILTK